MDSARWRAVSPAASTMSDAFSRMARPSGLHRRRRGASDRGLARRGDVGWPRRHWLAQVGPSARFFVRFPCTLPCRPRSQQHVRDLRRRIATVLTSRASGLGSCACVQRALQLLRVATGPCPRPPRSHRSTSARLLSARTRARTATAAQRSAHLSSCPPRAHVNRGAPTQPTDRVAVSRARPHRHVRLRGRLLGRVRLVVRRSAQGQGALALAGQPR